MTHSIDKQSSPANKQMSRRSVLRIGCVGTLLAAAGAAGILSQTEFFDRIRGVTDMPLLDDETAWHYADGTLTVALENVAALQQPGSAVRLESDSLPEDLLIVHSSSDDYYVFVNACTHSGRKIDLTADGQLKCSSVGQSTFDSEGRKLSGPAEGNLTTYTVEQADNQLIITLT